MTEKYSLFQIDGGLGKHIAATAVAKCIKNNHPDRKLLIVCAYPEIFLNLDYVDRVYRLGNNPYFYQDYIEDKDTLIFKHEPYFTTEHVYKRMHLIENWCNLYNLEFDNETPDLSFNLRQKQIGKVKWLRDKPIMVIQTNGGPLDDNNYPYSWTRDIPYSLSQQLVEFYGDNYHIIQICRHEANRLPNVESIIEPMSNMELLSIMSVAEKSILIDSCLQHASAAIGKKSTVLWVGTSPKVFGYEIHNNVVANLPKGLKLPDSYLFDYSFNGVIHECPFFDDNIFDINEIIESVG